jgi:hypothetical protein
MAWSICRNSRNNSECIELSMNYWSKRLSQVWSLTTYAETANALTQTTLNRCQSKQTRCAEYRQSFKRRIKPIVNTVTNYSVRTFIFTQNAIQETAKSVQTQSLRCAGTGCLTRDFVNVGTLHTQKANVSLATCMTTGNKRGEHYVAG